jgi:hypothetical protein
MNTTLTALRPENPVAVMAAYGILRLLTGARLRWAAANPELDYDGDVIADLAALLPERRQAPELRLLDDPREKHVKAAGGYATLAEQMPHEWLTAMSAETADGIQSTRLLLFSGNHKFVAAARELMDGLARLDVQDRVREALLGPWRYDTRAQAWGWDAAARDDTAAMAAAPSAKDKLGVPGAYWLAWESLPLWQMVGGRTVGHERRTWSYPTCAEWLGWDGLKALVLGRERMDPRELTAMGVRVWTAPILDTNSTGGKELGLAEGTAAGATASRTAA